MNKASQIFKKGSKTYYTSSLFFSKEIKKDVFDLYAFVRTADDFVDSIPQKTNEFDRFKNDYVNSISTGYSDVAVIDNFIKLAKRKNFDLNWVNEFLKAMEQDTKISVYSSYQELEKYMHGSAEVIGLMMAKILDLPDKSYVYAARLGRSMQLVNFIRDIEEDNSLGRQYIPKSDSDEYGLMSLKKEDIKKNITGFENLVRKYLDIYFDLKNNAEKGFDFIPRRSLIPIRTASQMYNWTAMSIYKNPTIVYEKKLKPSRAKILAQIFRNFLTYDSK